MWASEGGEGSTNTNFGTYRSFDGVQWKQTTNQLGPVRLHELEAFRGSLWLMGGLRHTTLSNQIVRSENGVNWTVVGNADWTPRLAPGAVVFDNRLWILGGQDATGHMNDVWVSDTGESWSRLLTNAPWPARSSHACVVAEGKIWILGGRDNSTFFSDVWTSVNGLDWTQETNSAPWGPRGNHGAVVFNNKIWVIGGGNFLTQFTDVWSLDLAETETDFQYGYDAVDRLTSVDNSQGIRIRYTYDPAGNRLSKETKAVLSAFAGPVSPQSRGVASNLAQAGMAQIELKGLADSEGANISALTFTTGGSGDESTAITRAQLWLDADANGISGGTDIQLGADVVPSTDNGLLAFTGLGLAVPPGESRYLLLTYDFGGSGTEGDVFHVSLPDRHAFQATSGASSRNLYVLGTPIGAATVTISTDTTPPDFSGIETAYPAKNSVILGWQKATDNQDSQDELRYAIWVSDAPFAGQVIGEPDFLVEGEPADAEFDTTRLYHIVEGLANGQTYYFLARAEDSKRNRSANLEELDATPVAPSYPLEISATNGSVSAAPSGMLYEEGSIVTLIPVPSEGFIFSGWSGDLNSPDQEDDSTLALVVDSPKTITATFAAGTGDVQITVTPGNAQWAVVDAEGTQHSGTGDAVLTGLLAGPTSIAWSELDGYTLPASSDHPENLAPNSTLHFSGIYEKVGCITCEPDGDTEYEVGESACLGVPGTFTSQTPFQWSKQGIGILSEGRMAGVGCETLLIPDLTEEDSGTYVCQYDDGRIYSITITVNPKSVPQTTFPLVVVMVLAMLWLWRQTYRRRQTRQKAG